MLLQIKDAYQKEKMDIAPGHIVCGNGPAVVLLHSSMSSKDQWKPLMSLLANRLKFVSIDLAGYGDNTLPQNTHTFSTSDEIRIVEQVIADTIGRNEPFHLVGHSYGGAVALKLAIKIQPRIKSLTVFEPVVFHLLAPGETAYNEIKALEEKLDAAFRKEDRWSAAKLFIDYWSGKETFERLTKKNRDEFLRYIDKVRFDFKALFRESLSLEDYAALRMPVCMIRGEHSPIPSLQVFEILTQTLPDRSIHTVPGGHMSPITQFRRVNRIIETFLTPPGFGQTITGHGTS